MFARAIFTLTLAAVALASPALLARQQGSCNAGPVQCCNQVQPAGAPAASKALGLLSIPIQDVNTPIGLDCNPINVIGLGGNDCQSAPVCCDDVHQNGAVNVNCLPLDTQLP